VVKDKRALYALLLVVGMLSLAALACTSDQEWIIPRTATPTATYTPVPLSVETDYSIGDEIIIIGEVFQVPQTNFPEPDTRNNRVIGGGCFPGTTVTIDEIAQGDDGNLYFNVRCILAGWVPEANAEPVQ
jgi:hypothetical protein